MISPNSISTVLDFKFVGNAATIKKLILEAEAKVRDTIDRLLVNCSPTNKFVDPDFSPNPSDPTGKKVLYQSGIRKKPSLPLDSLVQWRRPNYAGLPHDDKGYSKDCALYQGGHCSGDVIQGQLGDCWFISSMAVIANEPGYLESIFFNGDTVKYHLGPNKEWYEKGLWVCRIFDQGYYRYAIIDDVLPCNKLGELYFGRCDDPSELWVPLLEKAYAKIMKGYDSLIGGFAQIGLRDLTGLCPESIDITDENKPNNLTGNDLLNYLHRRINSGSLLGVSASNVGGEGEGKGAFGLVTGHAYSILGLITINIPEPTNLLVCRNPWGSTEWQGDWSDGSPQKKRHIDLIKDAWSDRPTPQEKWLLGTNRSTANLQEDLTLLDDIDNGVFCIEFSDFIKYFEEVVCAINFPPEWRGRRLYGEWKAENSGGRASLPTWKINPLYKLIIPKDNCKVVISLTQQGRRAEHGVHFSEHLYAIAFRIAPSTFDFDSKTACLPAYIPNSSPKTYQITYSFGESTTLEIILNNGVYFLVPTTYDVGQFGKFCLSVYSDCQDFNLECSEIIGEEEELDYNIEEHQPAKKVDLGFDPNKYYQSREILRNMLISRKVNLEDVTEKYKKMTQAELEIPVSNDDFRDMMKIYGVQPDELPDELLANITGKSHTLYNSDILSLFYEEKTISFAGEDYLRKVLDNEVVKQGITYAKKGMARAKAKYLEVKGDVNENCPLLRNCCCGICSII